MAHIVEHFQFVIELGMRRLVFLFKGGIVVVGFENAVKCLNDIWFGRVAY